MQGISSDMTIEDILNHKGIPEDTVKGFLRSVSSYLSILKSLNNLSREQVDFIMSQKGSRSMYLRINKIVYGRLSKTMLKEVHKLNRKQIESISRKNGELFLYSAYLKAEVEMYFKSITRLH